MNKRSTRTPSPNVSASKADIVLTPTSTPSETPHRISADSKLDLANLTRTAKMDTARDEKTAAEVEIQGKEEPVAGRADEETTPTADQKVQKTNKKGSRKCRRHAGERMKKSKKSSSREELSSEDSSDEDSESESDETTSTSEDSSSEEERKRKERSKRRARRRKAASKKHRRRKRRESPSSSESEISSSDSDSDSDTELDRRRKHRRSRKYRKQREREPESDYTEEDEEVEEEESPEDRAERLQQELDALMLQTQRSRGLRGDGGLRRLKMRTGQDPLDDLGGGKTRNRTKSSKKKKRKPPKRASTLEFKRVDQLWDSTIHNYKLKESAEDQEDEFNQYIFTVRRTFDWENKYRNTLVDIKSKLLREALSEVMREVKGVSLVEEEPSVDPNMLFLYVEELRTHAKKTLKARIKKEKKRKQKKRLKLQIAHCKVLLRYLDQDYDETKKTLYPLLEAGNITFDLLWALFKPNTLAYTATYGAADEPRCFKVDYATKESSFMRGEWYSIEGRYLEYDGKNFGLGEFEVSVDAFKGPRKITSLATYPMQYHKDPVALKEQLLERGKKFVTMQGMNYKFHKGLAFQKKKKTVAKVNINGRVMVDPAIFRRILPNYIISSVKPKDADDLMDPNSDDMCSDCCGSGSESEEDAVEGYGRSMEEKEEKERTKLRVVFDKNDKLHVVPVNVDENGEEVHTEKLDALPGGESSARQEQFTEEELLIASPVVLGFAFSEKLWLEFSLSGIKEIEWNEGAFKSLVLPDNQKSIVKALVETHKFHAAKTIDDVVQGKGKGLVAVLHGPPGTGKTLSAEGIAELLKCPLYAVSAGELGTDSGMLERELNKIMDIAHSWGAVLLLDEADVFLEKREINDLHRNALVSIFLRLLEYFQGILFLTTNRVGTFDEAFQSRIHLALRYEPLTHKAKKEIWKLFLEKVRVMEGVDTVSFSDADFTTLAKHNLNGRQIKNAVRTAQALAVNQQTKLSMDHIRNVLEVAENFEHDLKGGTGYMDAMRSYT